MQLPWQEQKWHKTFSEHISEELNLNQEKYLFGKPGSPETDTSLTSVEGNIARPSFRGGGGEAPISQKRRGQEALQIRKMIFQKCSPLSVNSSPSVLVNSPPILLLLCLIFNQLIFPDLHRVAIKLPSFLLFV